MDSFRTLEISLPAHSPPASENKPLRRHFIQPRLFPVTNTLSGSLLPSTASCTCSTASPTRPRESSAGVAISPACTAVADRDGKYSLLAVATVEPIPRALSKLPTVKQWP